MLNSISVEGLIALPALMVGFLVAIAIFNFEDSKRGLQIDVPTVISQVVKVNSVLLAIFFVSLVVIFWPDNTNTNTIYVLAFLTPLYLVGLVLLTRSLTRAFKWARSIETGQNNNFRAIARTRYLEHLDDNEKRDAWEKIWQADDGTRKLINERQLIKLFVSSVKNIRDKSEFAPWLVQDLISTIATIHLDDPVIMQELVNFCMGDSYGFTDEDNIDDRRNAGELHYSMNLRRLYFAILKQSLQHNDNSFFTLIDASRAYLREHELKEHKFIQAFAPNFFEYIKDRTNEYWIWETLPDDWKVTLNNLTSDSIGKVSFAWLNAYVRWLNTHELLSDKPIDDMSLDKVTRNILPSTDPIVWARLYAFHWSPYGSNEGEDSEYAQVKNYIKNHPTFGYMSHVMTLVGDGDREAETRKQMANTTDEALNIASRTTIFPAFHNPAVMEKYHKAIQELKVEYADNEDDARRLEWLDNTLKDITSRIEAFKLEQSTAKPEDRPNEQPTESRKKRVLARLLDLLLGSPEIH